MSMSANEFVAKGMHVALWTTQDGIPSYELFGPKGPLRINLDGVIGEVNDAGDFNATYLGKAFADGEPLRTLRISNRASKPARSSSPPPVLFRPG